MGIDPIIISVVVRGHIAFKREQINVPAVQTIDCCICGLNLLDPVD
jgi:hypothetical protein